MSLKTYSNQNLFLLFIYNYIFKSDRNIFPSKNIFFEERWGGGDVTFTTDDFKKVLTQQQDCLCIVDTI